MAGPIISDDGRFVWDGAKWQSRYSPDGKWIWSGEEWLPAPPRTLSQPIIMSNPSLPEGGKKFLAVKSPSMSNNQTVGVIMVAILLLLSAMGYIVEQIDPQNNSESQNDPVVSDILGCTDSKASNYNSLANVDDNSCQSIKIYYIFSSYCNGNDVEYLDPDWNIYSDYAPVNEDGITTWFSPVITLYENQTMAFTVYSNDETDCQIVMEINEFVDGDDLDIAYKEAWLEANRDITLAADIVV